MQKLTCEEPVDGLLELVLTGVGGGTFPLSPPPAARPEVGVVADGLVLRVTAVPFSPTLCSDEVEELGLFVPVDPREDLGLGLGEIPGLFPPFTELKNQGQYSPQITRHKRSDVIHTCRYMYKWLKVFYTSFSFINL